MNVMEIIFIILIFGINADETNNQNELTYNYSSYNSFIVNTSLNSYSKELTDDDSSVISFFRYSDGDWSRYEYTIQNSLISKTGKSSNLDNSFTYCINSAVLNSGHDVKISDSFITTNADGAIALCTRKDGSITVSQSTISTTDSNSPAFHSYSGYISGENSIIKTKGQNSPAMSVGKNGQISCRKSQITTNGKGSPLIDAKGTVFLNNIIGNASNSQAIIIDGVESLHIETNSNITCSGKGIAEDSSDSCGILIKNTTKNDRVETTFIDIKDSRLEITSDAPMFKVDGATVDFSFSKSNINSKILVEINKVSSKINIYMRGCEVKGDILIDDNTELYIIVQGDGNFTGAINPENKAGYINLYVDEGSFVSLTGNSYVTEYYSKLDDGIKKNSFSLNSEENSSANFGNINRFLFFICLLILM